MTSRPVTVACSAEAEPTQSIAKAAADAIVFMKRLRISRLYSLLLGKSTLKPHCADINRRVQAFLFTLFDNSVA